MVYLTEGSFAQFLPPLDRLELLPAKLVDLHLSLLVVLRSVAVRVEDAREVAAAPPPHLIHADCQLVAVVNLQVNVDLRPDCLFIGRGLLLELLANARSQMLVVLV